MFFSSGIFNAINLRTICNSNLLSAYNSLVSCVFIFFTASKKLTHIVSLVTIFTNCVSLYSGTYFGSLYSYPFLFIRQYMQNQSDRKKTKQLYNEMHPRKRYGNNFYNITFNFSLRHFPCYFRFTCRSDFAVSFTDSVSDTMFFFYKLFLRYLIR